MTTRAKTPQKSNPPESPVHDYPDAIRGEIALRAYYRFEDRVRSGNNWGEVDDWLVAEQEVLAERQAAHPELAMASDRSSEGQLSAGRRAGKTTGSKVAARRPKAES